MKAKDRPRPDKLVSRLARFIQETSSSLPDDAEQALRKALRREAKGSSARMVLETILRNVELARAAGTPACQDTGTLTFFVSESLRRRVTPDVLGEAVARASANGWLRRNTIDPVTGRSIDTNVCHGAPVVHYVEVKSEDGRGGRDVSLLMKGGGSENMSRQFSLPDASLGAGRDLEGVRRAVLAAVQQAQGYGCAPGILGVCVGGDRASGYEEAKLQLLRNLADTNPDPALARLERRILREANSLGIGPMGLGGKTTLLAVKVGARPRVPASFFVTVAYLCWAARRRSIAL
ncbi:MAG: fumarate hydratase [Kiritimatiellae bacterium]|nr:fumarate hydratase [Kiritimatiellia bacterium]